MKRHVRRAVCLALSAHLIESALTVHAAEAPGALTIIVRGQYTERPVLRFMITDREIDLVRSLESMHKVASSLVRSIHASIRAGETERNLSKSRGLQVRSTSSFH